MLLLLLLQQFTGSRRRPNRLLYFSIKGGLQIAPIAGNYLQRKREPQNCWKTANSYMRQLQQIKDEPTISRKLIKDSKFIDSVHLMRGVAAMFVVLDHIVGRPPYAAFNSVFGFLHGIGSCGVAAFFCISGIVLPLSLGESYRWGKFPHFLGRRATRIEPTYLASVAIAAVMNFVMSAVAPHGTVLTPSLKQLALHALYLIPFSNSEWIQPAYWTLAVEFQFYLAIGLVFPLISILAEKWKPMAAALCSSFALLVFVWPLCREVQLLKYSPFFALGMLIASHRIFAFNKRILFCCGALVQGLALWSGLALPIVFAATVAAIIATMWTGPINKDHPKLKPFWFLGTISYSLYVSHQVFCSAGENVARLILRTVHGTVGLILANLIPFGSLLASLVAAWILYKLVEMPTSLLSKQMKSRKSICKSNE